MVLFDGYQRSLMLPPPLLRWAYLRRAARNWLLIRAVVSVVMLFALVPPADVLQQPLTGVVLLVAISVVAGFVDYGRYGEGALLRNLGVSRVMATAFFAGPAVLGEILLLCVSVFA